jgi:hypothetical protein
MWNWSPAIETSVWRGWEGGSAAKADTDRKRRKLEKQSFITQRGNVAGAAMENKTKPGL